ncbi:hypothetical protein ACJMK2_037861 [Sinanodonta woodiana]|uniref:Endoplasmic reticulum lectin 1 n=1 Tax=Sinanodonta woodiana TaxID=1069815 RepID=A0ABD3WLS8_SINWO
MKMFLTFLIGLFLPVTGYFNPFSDSDLFAIKWLGPLDLEKNYDGRKESVFIQTASDEKYKCMLPMSKVEEEAKKKANYIGPSADELMKTLFLQSVCSYRIESYWTYELCHGRHIRQYHEQKELILQKPKIQEFYLGKSTKASDLEKSKGKTMAESAEKEVIQEIRRQKIEGVDLPYYEVNMTDGTDCDLTGTPRASHAKYVCQPDGRGEIYSLKEVSTCEYELIILTSVLCSHPDFKPKNPPVSEIQCHALEGSPPRPKQLEVLETEGNPITMEAFNSETIVHTGKMTTSTPMTTTQPPATATIGPTADKQLLREFLNGDYCLHGGSGWWKHEFCYGKHARQYHDDQNGRVSVYLGYWHEEKHFEWLAKHPSKKPKEKGNRKSISLHYSSGDVCDLTGTPRFVEVKLKCLSGSQHPHAVSIYLIEPKSCEYVLGVESPIFCELLDQADDNGLFPRIEL